VVAGAALALVLAGLTFLAVRAFGGGEDPPAFGAAAMAPSGALVFVHLSTDAERGATERAVDLAKRFDAYERIRDGILQRLAGTEQDVRVRDVAPWLGDEVALTLVDAGQATAGSLVIAKVTDEAKARKFLERNPRRSAVRRYKGDRIDEFGTLNVAFKKRYMLIGQSLTVQRALDQANGRGAPLSKDPTYRRAMKGAPADRVATAYVTVAGLRRLLVPQGDVLGSLAVLLDTPALEGVAVSAVAEDDRLRIRAHSALDAAAQKRAGLSTRTFEPDLLDAAPQNTLAFLGVNGVSGALGNLVTAAAGGASAGGVGPLLQRLRTELGKQTGGALERDLLALFEDEVAVVVTKATPAPTLALVTKTGDENRTAAVLKRLQQPLAKLLTPAGEAAPRWRADDLGGGVSAQTLATPTGAEVTYAVFDGRLVLGTGPDAIRRIKDADDDLSDAETFKSVETRSEKVTSIGFLDFSQLLELGEQTGLNDSRAYLAARDDLRKVRAIGFSSHGDEGETTAEILLSIP
jgi:hypothetical protein